MEQRKSQFEPKDDNGMECEVCRLKKLSVSHRSNAYANDVGNDPTAMHTVCDECDYQNAMDI